MPRSCESRALQKVGTTLVLGLTALAMTGCQSAGTPKTVQTDDPCGAQPYRHLIGTEAKDLNMSQFKEGTRLLYPTTPTTRDYRIDRLNIHADRHGKIIRLDCS